MSDERQKPTTDHRLKLLATLQRDGEVHSSFAAPMGSEMARELGDANAMGGNAMTGLNMRGEYDTPLMRDLMESTKIIEAVRLNALGNRTPPLPAPTGSTARHDIQVKLDRALALLYEVKCDLGDVEKWREARNMLTSIGVRVQDVKRWVM